MGRSVPLLVRVSAMNVHYDHFNSYFLDARQFVCDVLGYDMLFMGHAWDAAWDDMLHCWCGCPL